MQQQQQVHWSQGAGAASDRYSEMAGRKKEQNNKKLIITACTTFKCPHVNQTFSLSLSLFSAVPSFHASQAMRVPDKVQDATASFLPCVMPVTKSRSLSLSLVRCRGREFS